MSGYLDGIRFMCSNAYSTWYDSKQRLDVRQVNKGQEALIKESGLNAINKNPTHPKEKNIEVEVPSSASLAGRVEKITNVAHHHRWKIMTVFGIAALLLGGYAAMPVAHKPQPLKPLIDPSAQWSAKFPENLGLVNHSPEQNADPFQLATGDLPISSSSSASLTFTEFYKMSSVSSVPASYFPDLIQSFNMSDRIKMLRSKEVMSNYLEFIKIENELEFLIEREIINESKDLREVQQDLKYQLHLKSMLEQEIKGLESETNVIDTRKIFDLKNKGKISIDLPHYSIDEHKRLQNATLRKNEQPIPFYMENVVLKNAILDIFYRADHVQKLMSPIKNYFNIAAIKTYDDFEQAFSDNNMRSLQEAVSDIKNYIQSSFNEIDCHLTVWSKEYQHKIEKEIIGLIDKIFIHHKKIVENSPDLFFNQDENSIGWQVLGKRFLREDELIFSFKLNGYRHECFSYSDCVAAAAKNMLNGTVPESITKRKFRLLPNPNQEI